MKRMNSCAESIGSEEKRAKPSRKRIAPNSWLHRRTGKGPIEQIALAAMKSAVPQLSIEAAPKRTPAGMSICDSERSNNLNISFLKKRYGKLCA